MQKAIVAIVGRPNVGKSTLFNKLTRTRAAITEDIPGVTRDRLYREVEWQGQHFMLVDTGGLELSSDAPMTEQVRRQVEIAIDSADLLLFVVDGKNGLTAEDADVAQLLRKSGKKVLLVVNKIDTHTTPPDVYEFYSLGLDALFVISAEQSYGLGDLLDEICAGLPEFSAKDEEDDAIHVAFVGKPNVGKSSLVNRLLGEDRMIVTDIAGTTRDSIDSTREIDGRSFVFIDTAGLRRKRYIDEKVERYSVIRTLRSIERADVCLVMIDATQGVAEQDSKIAGYAHEQGKAIAILVNKWDLVDKDTHTARSFEEEIRKELPFLSYAPILFASALTGQRIHRLIPLIITLYENSRLRISTGILNEILNEAITFNPTPTDKGERLKIYYMTQVGVAPPTFVLFVNKTSLMHFSYLRYIENQIRRRFRFDGVPLVLTVRPR